jgi:glycosyltransferase involved in cell wall biosynthesis
MSTWKAGSAPVTVVMISLNEAHNMRAVLENLEGWAADVLLLDSGSRDETVSLALAKGVRVYQRRFRGFGDQWNAALSLPVSTPYTMKLDPDERLTDELKASIEALAREGRADSIDVMRHLQFMGRRLPVSGWLLRVWRTGACRFSNVEVNEHPHADGLNIRATGALDHLDSPNLEHWLEKQNRYSTAEAVASLAGTGLSAQPLLFGNPMQRRMWLKKNFHRLPGRFLLFFLYSYLVQGAWRAGWVGFVWARLRADVMRFIHYKRREIVMGLRVEAGRNYGSGQADSRVVQLD